MSKIKIEPQGTEIEFTPGTSLLELSEDQDLGILFGCRQGACGTCLIGVDPVSSRAFEAPSEDETAFLATLGCAAGQRLACQCVLKSDATISVDPEHRFESPEGFLILSHRGFSFIDDLIARARAMGRQVYVLMSAPTFENAGRIAQIGAQADWLRTTLQPSLTGTDVRAALQDLRAQGKKVVACVSVWEGYRVLMAEANLALGAPDELPGNIAGLLDKHLLRKNLRRAGLSEARSVVLNRRNLTLLQKSSVPVFVKPRRGLASFGAFRLGPSLRFEDLQALSCQMQDDEDYQEIFSGVGAQFVAEDFIGGTEMSFEVIARDGLAHVLAVHEKVELEEAVSTTLESACVSPPTTVSDAECARGAEFIQDCFRALGLTHGCYHVEVKHDPATRRWEIIEINPRVGGALINPSTAVRRGGVCLLELWLRSLDPRTSGSDAFAAELSRPASPEHETFFRVFFGTPGRTLSRIEAVPSNFPPSLVRIAAKAGESLPEAAREIFLAQAMWTGARGELTGRIGALLESSRGAIAVEYSGRARQERPGVGRASAAKA